MKPKPGDHVIVTDSLDQTWSGEVVDLLSKQFTYETDNGDIRYQFYSQDYEVMQ